MKVFLSGEGRCELGSRAGHRSFQSDDEPGALHALLARVRASGWEIGGSCEWKRIRKFRAGKFDHEDTRNVLGAALDAKEAGCDVLAFSRDMDRDLARDEAIEEGIRRVEGIGVIGGVAKPTIEGWILALLQERRSEDMSSKRAEALLVERIPDDAASLRRWLERAEQHLPR